MKVVYILLGFLLLISFSYTLTAFTTCTNITAPGEYVLTAGIVASTDDCINITISNVTLTCNAGTYINGVTGNAIKVYNSTTTLSNITIEDCVVINSNTGIYIRDAHNLTLSGIHSANNSVYGLYLNEVANSTFGNYASVNNTRGLHFIGNANNNNTWYGATFLVQNIFMDSSLAAFATVENNFTNLFFSNSSNSGLGGSLHWDLINLTSARVNSNNLRIEPDFVSFNVSTGSGAEQFNRTTTVTLENPGSCNNLRIYKEFGFPVSRDSILENGTIYATNNICTALNVSFPVTEFSGYAVTFIPEESSSKTSSESKEDIDVSYDSGPFYTGEEITFEFESDGTPLDNVEVLLYKIDNYRQKVAKEIVDEIYSFVPSEAGEYWLRFEKDGYKDGETFFDVEKATEAEEEPEAEPEPEAEAEPQPECTIDAECTPAEPEPYTDYQCVEGVCVEIHSQPPAEELVQENALEAITDAETQIESAKQEGKLTEDAESKLLEAQEAYDSGNYETAKELASESITLIQEPMAEEPEAELLPEMEEQPQQEADYSWCWWAVVIAVVLLVVIWITITQMGEGKKEEGYSGGFSKKKKST